MAASTRHTVERDSPVPEPSFFRRTFRAFEHHDFRLMDEGQMWPTSYALKELNVEEEARIIELVKKAAG